MAAGARAEEAGLDDLMLAMDVVDTLRHEEAQLARELGAEDRDEALMARLRGLYESQGLVVTDEVLRAGISALRERRFAYERKGSAFGRRLARLWIARGRIAAGVAVAVALVGGYAAFDAWRAEEARRAEVAAAQELSERLPAALAAARAGALAEAARPPARAEVERLAALAQGHLAAGDAPRARAAIGEIEALRDRLAAAYVLRIVSRPGEDTGVFRIPDANERARNFYLVVEAIGPDGRALALPVRSEETGGTRTVTRFAVRVPEATFERVRRDKADDGILREDRLGEKPRGALEVDWAMPVEGGMIYEW